METAQPPVGIVAAAYCLPERRKPVAEVFRDEAIPAERLAADVDFQGDIGIEAVHVADELPSALALEASRRALERAGLEGSDLDLLIDFTSIPEDYVAPTWSAAGLVQGELGAHGAFATAVNTGGCASYHLALRTALAMLRARDDVEVALLFAGDRVPERNHTYYPITVVCDGGSAVVLRKGHPRGVVLAVETASLGELHDVWWIPGLPHRKPEDAHLEWLHMHADVKRFNEGVIPVNLFMFRKVMKRVMKRAGVNAADVALYIYPTFSTWDQKSFMEGFRLEPEKVYTAPLARHGHIQENDMVVNYADALAEGRVGEGQLVMALTNGAGFAWGAALIRV